MRIARYTNVDGQNIIAGGKIEFNNFKMNSPIYGYEAGGSILIKQAGDYHVSVVANIEASAAGVDNLALNTDDDEVFSASVTSAAQGDARNLVMEWVTTVKPAPSGVARLSVTTTRAAFIGDVIVIIERL